ncbi:MAG: DUF2695 domain-containing protein [Acidobacteria bacterium]|nr:MAG: DUF2695 domain-containing protein [Acidobacteriota bacterium]
MPIIRKREIENLEQLTAEELADIIKRLPLSRQMLETLFEYIENKLKENPCNHNLNYSLQFALKNKLDLARVTSWLNSNGAYCDCKVIDYIATEWRKVFDKSRHE